MGIDINLSVQHILNCGGVGSCHGGSVVGPYQWLHDLSKRTGSGISYETSNPYMASSNTLMPPLLSTVKSAVQMLWRKKSMHVVLLLAVSTLPLFSSTLVALSTNKAQVLTMLSQSLVGEKRMANHTGLYAIHGANTGGKWVTSVLPRVTMLSFWKITVLGASLVLSPPLIISHVSKVVRTANRSVANQRCQL